MINTSQGSRHPSLPPSKRVGLKLWYHCHSHWESIPQGMMLWNSVIFAEGGASVTPARTVFWIWICLHAPDGSAAWWVTLTYSVFHQLILTVRKGTSEKNSHACSAHLEPCSSQHLDLPGSRKKRQKESQQPKKINLFRLADFTVRYVKRLPRGCKRVTVCLLKNTQRRMWDVPEQNTRGKTRTLAQERPRRNKKSNSSNPNAVTGKLSGKQTKRFLSINPNGQIVKWCAQESDLLWRQILVTF